MKKKKEILRKSEVPTPVFTREARERFVKVVLRLLAASLTFVGPTYLIYLIAGWGVSPALLALLGLLFFSTGMILFWRSIRE